MTTKLILVALGALAATSAVADTIAWYHFDEYEPGVQLTQETKTAVKDSVTSGSANAYVTVGSSADSQWAHSEYMPCYDNPVRGTTVYDPVSKETYRTKSSMRFATAESSYYGGILEAGNAHKGMNWATDALTVECFVCTTGSTFNTFAPIFGKTATSSSRWSNEAFALYMLSTGKLAIRMATTKSDGARDVKVSPYSGTTAGAAINDGRWHHVALVYSQTTGKATAYVDYAEAVTLDCGAGRPIDYGPASVGDAYKAFVMGGYCYASTGNVGRKFDGCIDELRISNAALAPAQFLRLKEADDDVVLRMRFDTQMGRQNAIDNTMWYNDINVNASYKGEFAQASGASKPVFEPTDRVATIVRAGLYDDAENNTGCMSFPASTASRYVKVPGITTALANWGSATVLSNEVSYTLECAFKLRSGVTSSSQTPICLGTKPIAGVTIRMYNGKKAITFTGNDAGTWTGYNYTGDWDDTAWHRVAIVNDCAAHQARYYLDGQLVLCAKSYENAMDKGSSIWIGCGYSSSANNFFDGWIDDVRLTKRALTPDEFLNASTAKAESATTLAFYNFEDSWASDINADVVGEMEGVKHTTKGEAPTFADCSTASGPLLANAATSEDAAENKKCLSFADSVAGVKNYTPLFEQKDFTVEFFGENLNEATNSAGLVGYLPGSGSTYDTAQAPIWKLYRNGKSAEFKIRLFVTDETGSHEVSPSPLFAIEDSRNVSALEGLHHYAVTFDQSSKPGYLRIRCYMDHRPMKELNDIEGAEDAYCREVKGGIDYAGASSGGSYAGRLSVGEGGGDNKLNGRIDALRFSKGVLEPGEFLHMAAAKVGDTYHTGLQSAFDAAVSANGTVESLRDLTTRTNVVIVGTGTNETFVTFRNDHEILFENYVKSEEDKPGYNLYSFLVCDATVTLEGTGALVKVDDTGNAASGAASLVVVGCKTSRAGKNGCPPAKEDGTAYIGNLIVKGGTLRCGAEGQTAVGTPSNSVKVDCGTCTFDGGDIQNWRKANGGCASAGTADARILVNAGRFVIGDPKGENDNIFEVEDGGQVFIPADSKALFNQKLTNSGFLPDGYRTKKNADGWYEVCEKLGLGLFIR